MKIIFLFISIFFLYSYSANSNEFVLDCTLIDSTSYADTDDQWEVKDNSSIAGQKQEFIFDTINKSVFYDAYLEKDWEVILTNYNFFFSKHLLIDDILGNRNNTLTSQTFAFNFISKLMIRTLGRTNVKHLRSGMPKANTFSFIYSCN